jgi:tetratricopeptide (TPR) repeat protein
LAYFDQEQWNEAIAEFEEAIRLDPELGEVYLLLGYAYAFGPKNFAQAAQNLQEYLALVPDDPHRADIEADIAEMRAMASSPGAPTGFDIPEGKAMFVFENNTGEVWLVDVGPHTLEVPPNVPPQEVTIATVILDPGTYTWQAHSMSANYYITDGSGNKAFEFTVTAGEVYTTGCCR